MTVYKEEVLNKRCWILFAVDGEPELIPYRGVIEAYQAHVVTDGESTSTTSTPAPTITRLHYIHFDDGDLKWFNLEAEEAQGRLSWQEQQHIPARRFVLPIVA